MPSLHKTPKNMTREEQIRHYWRGITDTHKVWLWNNLTEEGIIEPEYNVARMSELYELFSSESCQLIDAVTCAYLGAKANVLDLCNEWAYIDEDGCLHSAQTLDETPISIDCICKRISEDEDNWEWFNEYYLTREQKQVTALDF